jgi:hypothetical protein
MVEEVRMFPFSMAVLCLPLRRPPGVTLGITSVRWKPIRMLWLAKRARLPVRALALKRR